MNSEGFPACQAAVHYKVISWNFERKGLTWCKLLPRHSPSRHHCFPCNISLRRRPASTQGCTSRQCMTGSHFHHSSSSQACPYSAMQALCVRRAWDRLIPITTGDSDRPLEQAGMLDETWQSMPICAQKCIRAPSLVTQWLGTQQ